MNQFLFQDTDNIRDKNSGSKYGAGSKWKYSQMWFKMPWGPSCSALLTPNENKLLSTYKPLSQMCTPSKPKGDFQSKRIKKDDFISKDWLFGFKQITLYKVWIKIRKNRVDNF